MMKFFITIVLFTSLTFNTSSLFAGTTTVMVTDAAQLKAALSAAESDPNDTVIELAAGEYLTTDNGGTFQYNAAVDKTLTLAGAGKDQTILDGSGVHQVLVLTDMVSNVGQISLSQMTLQNGRSTAVHGGGATIETQDSEVIIEDCQFFNNRVTGERGGGLYAFAAPGGGVTLNRNLFQGNAVVGPGLSDGGGAFIGGDFGSVTITNNIFFDNTTNRNGGGLAVATAINTNITNNTIWGNQAASAGGVWLNLFALPTHAELFNNIIYGNTATAGPDMGDDLFIMNNDPDIATADIFFNDMGGVCVDDGNCMPSGLGIDFFANLDVDPELSDPAAGDFSLSPGSPVMDAGTEFVPDGLPNPDFAGNPRPFGNDPDMGALEAVPGFGVDPTAVNFSGVAPQNSAGQILTLSNSGNAPVQIQQAEFQANGPISVNEFGGPQPCNTITPLLEGQSSCTVEVLFAPEIDGNFSATLSWNTDDPQNAMVVIAITATTAAGGGSSGGCALSPLGAASSWAVVLAGLFFISAIRRFKAR